MLHLCGGTSGFILALSYSLQYYCDWVSEAAVLMYLQLKRKGIRTFSHVALMPLLKQWAYSCRNKSLHFWCEKLYLCWNIYQYPSFILSNLEL